MSPLRACAMVLLLLSGAARADEVRQIPLATRDLVYDGKSQRIYASVPSSAGAGGNSIVPVDPATGAVGTPIAVGTEPGKLALADNGQYLYVVLDGTAVRRVDLAAQTPGLVFPLGRDRFSVPYVARDIKVLPGNPEAIAAARSALSNEGIANYVNGVQRRTSADRIGANAIEFGASASRLYALTNSSPSLFRRLSVDRSGVSVLDVTGSLIYGEEMKFDGGRLYGASGEVIDPEARRLLGTFPVAPVGNLVAPDTRSRRVFFLFGNGPTRTLVAFDAATLRPVGSLPILGVMGRASSLIRWGVDGLAFRTDADQLFLIRTGLIPPSPDSADLSVTALDVPDPATLGQDVTYTAVVTNHGPAAATEVSLMVPLPGGARLVSAAASQGGVTTSDGQIAAGLGTLPAGASAAVTVLLTPTVPGTLTLTAAAATRALDPNPANNSATQATTVGPVAPPAPGSLRQIALPTNDLVYDWKSQRIYASVPGRAGDLGNSIVAIDPTTGAVGPPLFVGSEPGKLALSDDGRFLYVALDGAASVRRLELPSQTLEPPFFLGSDPLWGPFFAPDMEVLPRRPLAVAVIRFSRPTRIAQGIAIYDRGVARPGVVPGYTGGTLITFGASAARLYGVGGYVYGNPLRRLAVNASGVSLVDNLPDLIGGYDDQKFADGRLYGTTGRVVDPEARRLLGTFSLPGAVDDAMVVPEPSAGRVFYVARDGAVRRLFAFDPRTFQPVGSLAIAGVLGRTRSLVRWGVDGLAFRTDADQLFLIRKPLVGSSVPAADLSVTAAPWPSAVTVGQNLSSTLTVANAGPAAATSVRLTDLLPAGVTFVSATASQGSVSQAGASVVANLGTLASGGRATVTIVVTPTTAGALTNMAGVGGSELDPTPENNTAAQATTAHLPTPQESEEIRQIPLATRDLVYDRLRDKIYASVPASAGSLGGSVVVIDPAAGTVGVPIFVGDDPGELAISDDSQYLYVALDRAGAIRRVDLATQKAGPPFSLGESRFGGALFVADMAVLPGHPEAIAVSRRNLASSPRYEGVAVYDNGVPRPKVTADRSGGNNILEFSASAARLYGALREGAGLNRIAIDASGATDVDSSYLVGGLQFDMRFDSGLLYASSGQAADPEAQISVGTFAVPFYGNLVEPDSSVGRVFFLTGENLPGAESTRVLRAFDQRRFFPLGTLDVPGVSGRASSLLRWGESGLAFRTDADQVFLIRTTLVRSARPSADLSITQAVTPEPAAVGKVLTYTLTITNRGPAPATGVVVSDALPDTVTILSTAASQGISSYRGSMAGASLGDLPSGANATVTVVVTPTAAALTTVGVGSITSTARVTANELDPDPANNMAVQTTQVNLAASPHVVRHLALPASDIVYDRSTRRIFASVPGSAGGMGNSLVAVDPLTGAIDAPVFAGSEPGKLALSDNGQYLYVGLDGASAMRRFDIAARTFDLQFMLRQPGILSGLVVADMAVVPGSPASVAVSAQLGRSWGRHEALAIYDNGVQRPKALIDHALAGSPIEFGASPSRLYGFGNEMSAFEFYRLAVDPSGVSLLDATQQLLLGSGVDIAFDGGRIYASSGRVIDPEARKLLGQFTLPSPVDGALVAPDAAVGRVFFLTWQGSTCTLHAFDSRTFLPVGTLTIPGVPGRASRLIRWGEDGLAFATDGGQLVLIRTPWVRPAAPAADLAVTQTSSPDPVLIGGELTYTLMVTNRGPEAATGVTLVDPIAGKRIVSVTTSQGRGYQSSGMAAADLGDLAAGASATVTLVARPLFAPGQTGNTAYVRANELDPDPTNNRSEQLATVQLVPGRDLTGAWEVLGQLRQGPGPDTPWEVLGNFNVRNQGTAETPATQVRFYLSADANLDAGDTLLKEYPIFSLPSNGSRRINFFVLLPTGSVATGKYVIAVIDETDAVAEADEQNNRIVGGPIPEMGTVP